MAASTLHLLLILSALVMTVSVVRGEDDEPKEVSDGQDDAELFDEAEMKDEDEAADLEEMDALVKKDAWWSRRRRRRYSCHVTYSGDKLCVRTGRRRYTAQYVRRRWHQYK